MRRIRGIQNRRRPPRRRARSWVGRSALTDGLIAAAARKTIPIATIPMVSARKGGDRYPGASSPQVWGRGCWLLRATASPYAIAPRARIRATMGLAAGSLGVSAAAWVGGGFWRFRFGGIPLRPRRPIRRRDVGPRAAPAVRHAVALAHVALEIGRGHLLPIAERVGMFR